MALVVVFLDICDVDVVDSTLELISVLLLGKAISCYCCFYC